MSGMFFVIDSTISPFRSLTKNRTAIAVFSGAALKIVSRVNQRALIQLVARIMEPTPNAKIQTTHRVRRVVLEFLDRGILRCCIFLEEWTLWAVARSSSCWRSWRPARAWCWTFWINVSRGFLHGKTDLSVWIDFHDFHKNHLTHLHNISYVFNAPWGHVAHVNHSILLW